MELLTSLATQDAATRAATGWRRHELTAGERLFRQGAPSNTLYVVASGQLTLFVDGTALDEMGPGSTIGEASVFMPGELRLGSAVAATDAVVWALPRRRLRKLRDDPCATYDQLLDAGLRGTWTRLQQVDAELTHLGGTELKPVARPSAFQRLLDRLLRPGAPPEAAGVLLGVPGLSWADPDCRAAIAEQLEAVHMPEGRALFVQGDDSDGCIYLVGSGEVAIQREGPAGVQPLGELGPGSLFGAAAFVEAQPRTASVVATTSAWVFALPRDRVAALPPEARRAALEAVLFTMRRQLRAANTALVELRRPQRDFRQLLRAVGDLYGWRAGDPRLDVQLEDLTRPAPVPPMDEPTEALFASIREAVIGKDTALATPFGLRRLVYADYTASGRSLAFVEDFLRSHVMPLYANTHTEASASGLQTTRFREEARELVARSLGAGDDDTVLFVGSGATGGVNRLIDLLGLRLAEGQPRKPPAQRPVVFIGPYEHHSNLLPWRHCDVDLVMIPLDRDDQLDRDVLVSELERFADRPLRIGSFSAASNVTGVATAVDELAELLHAHGALSFWDYAAAGPYVPIDMNPTDRPQAYKDAVFLSPHKFIGGPGTPGVVALKTRLATSSVPTQPGGGTVDFVTGQDSLYSDSLTHREEAGTPAILESIRCGLVFQLKDRVGGHTIHAREQQLVRGAIESWSRNHAIEVLGPLEAERLSIVSFLIRHGRGYLHYNFVVALLNDLFGIQARGGCSCAGPYGAMLLGMDEAAGDAFLDLVGRGYAALKPGWARVNFNYFIDPAEYAFVVQAVNLVAVYGYAMLPAYRFDVHTGLWTHRDGNPYEPTRLADLRFEGGQVVPPPPPAELRDVDYDEVLAEGRRLLEAAAHAQPGAEPLLCKALAEEAEAWRWFPLPHEVAAWLSRGAGAGAINPPAVG